MENNFVVSVIIPVFNAAKYVSKAVESAVQLKEVGEIILVEDKSPDKALEVCIELEERFEKVKVFRHPNGENRGPSESRNLGILKSENDFIAFLDADDWYLPNRFEKDVKIFSDQPIAEAVYSYTILDRDIKNSAKQWDSKEDPRKSLGMEVSPKDFFIFYIENRIPFFHANSITFKRKFLLEGKLFDSRLFLHQDSELWQRLMRRGNFFLGDGEKPVAVERVHEGRRGKNRNTYTKLLMYAVLLDNIGVSNLFKFEKKRLIRAIIRTKSKNYTSSWKRKVYNFPNFWLAASFPDRFLNRFRKELIESEDK